MTEIKFQPRYTVENVVEARDRALKFMADKPECLEIDVSACEEVDTAGIQLFVSLIKEAEEQGVKVRVKGPLHPKVSAAFAASGVHYASISEALVDG